MDRLWPLLAAPLVGSFLGVLIRRLPTGRSIGWSRSACDACGAALGSRDLVPLASYMALGGACRHCRAAIAPFHWQIELAALLVPGSALLAGFAGPPLWTACAAGWALLTLSWIDAETMLLPEALTLPLLAGGLAQAAWLERPALLDRALAAAVGATLLWAVGLLYRGLRGREGLGMGDAVLLGAIGAWVGLEGLAPVLLGAAVAGLAWAGLLWWRGAALTRQTALPFGPFLALAGWAVLLTQ